MLLPVHVHLSLFNSVACEPAAEHLSETLKTMDPLPFQPPFSDRSIPDATDFPHGKADTRSQLIDDSLSQLIHGKADTKNKSHGIGGAATSMTGTQPPNSFH